MAFGDEVVRRARRESVRAASKEHSYDDWLLELFCGKLNCGALGMPQRSKRPIEPTPRARRLDTNCRRHSRRALSSEQGQDGQCRHGERDEGDR
jgi:hypothetical protein